MKTPLYEEHLRLSATMTDFAGWEMPVYYSSIVKEVEAVRTSAGIFDLSHMGEFLVAGAEAVQLLQFVTTNDLSRVGVGQAQYTLICNESGGIMDDLVIYRLEDELYMPVVNASNTTSDYYWMEACNSFLAQTENVSSDTGLIAVQGPACTALLQSLVDVDLREMQRFRVAAADIAGVSGWLASTGYTGGPGFEIYCASSDTPILWQRLLDAGAPLGALPAGLGARDVLRIEAGYPLYGQELDRSTTPVDANLMWVVKPGKGDFVGKDAILRAKDAGPNKILVGLEAQERCIPRHGYDVVSGDTHVGHITSGTFSPTLQKGIAMAYVQPTYAAVGSALGVKIRDKVCGFKVVQLPFYHPPKTE